MAIPREDQKLFRTMTIHLDNKRLGDLDLLSETFLAWLAGFLDGDGSIYVRIIRNKTFQLKFQILVSVSFTQSNAVHHVLILIYKALGKQGAIRKRETVGDIIFSNSEFNIKLLTKLIPYLYIKKPQAKLAIEIIKENKLLRDLSNIRVLDQTYSDKEEAFLKVCEKVEQLALLNAPGKTVTKRRVTIETVKAEFNKR